MAEECRSCKAPILWTVTVKEKRMPVNAEPSPVGNLVVIMRDGLPPLARAPDLFDVGLPRYTSHFANCPQSKGWRKGR